MSNKDFVVVAVFVEFDFRIYIRAVISNPAECTKESFDFKGFKGTYNSRFQLKSPVKGEVVDGSSLRTNVSSERKAIFRERSQEGLYMWHMFMS